MRPVSILKINSGRQGKLSTRAIVYLLLGIPFVFIVLPVFMALFLPAIQQAREAAIRTQARNQLKQFGMALHNYHDTYNTLPPSAVVAVSRPTTFRTASSTSETNGPKLNPEEFSSFLEFVEAENALNPDPVAQLGSESVVRTPHHGWMAALLPYVEAANLYTQIDFNEPWTSPRNAPVFRVEVPQYLHPGIVRKDSTSRRVNDFGASHYAGNSQLLLPNSMSKFRDITDGLSNTIMVGEVAAGFRPWGSPDNVRDPAAGIGNSATQFGCHCEGVVQFLFCDGSVRVVTGNITPETLRDLANPSDGNRTPEF